MITALRAQLASALLFLASVSALGQEWPRFRGPNGSGVSAVTTIPVRWTEKDFSWKAKLPGVGHSSPVGWGERIFVTSAEEQTGKRFVICLRTHDGRRLWTRESDGEQSGKHPDNSYASATPAVDDRFVFVAWGTPKEFFVLAFNHQGKEVWRRDLGSFKGGHGFGASPIVFGKLLIVANDQDGDSVLFALDRDTGATRWQIPRQSRATYSTPCIFNPAGGAAQLIFTNYEKGITSVDPETGRLNWESDVFDKGHVETAIGSPVVNEDLILGTCGWLGVRQEVVAIRPSKEKKKQPAEVYRIARSAPLCTTPLIKADLLFLWSDGGVVTCADVRTGDIYWRERVPGSYYGSPVCAGNHLYGVSREGEVIVLAASKQFRLVERNPLGEGSHSTPAIIGGRMYVRTFSQLLAIGGPKSKRN